ncbi:hypothetical protein EYF80_057091 [Liparis tanakae]|uniref:Uncharacterized protein n=1 Tax=Liparis tanakae TaxID=230148 RepID=A0A4Z2EWK8_9TELE|nr:hypothetical protein EYF80_057091 [Liparis tanakae]
MMNMRSFSAHELLTWSNSPSSASELDRALQSVSVLSGPRSDIRPRSRPPMEPLSLSGLRRGDIKVSEEEERSPTRGPGDGSGAYLYRSTGLRYLHGSFGSPGSVGMKESGVIYTFERRINYAVVFSLRRLTSSLRLRALSRESTSSNSAYPKPFSLSGLLGSRGRRTALIWGRWGENT